MTSPSIEKLYEFYEIVNNKDEKEETKKTAYQSILEGVSGDEKEKRLASQFISKFFKLFPDLYEVAFNKLLDLCEDDNILIRKQVIQYLPSVAKSVPDYIPKIADTLTQMLVADDNTEIMLIYAALNTVLKMDFKVALEAVFHQLITQLEEANELINIHAFKYLHDKLGSDCTLEPEMETFVEASAKKLLTKLVGKEEYSLVIGILSFLKSNSTLIGRQKLVNEISEQTKKLGKIDEASKFQCLISNCKQTVKLLSKNVHADDLLMYLLENVTDLGKLTTTDTACSLFELMRVIVDIGNRGKNVDTSLASQVPSVNLSGEEGLKCAQTLFTLVLDQLPSMPEEGAEEAIAKMGADKARLSLQEASLLSLYCVCKCRPDTISASADDVVKNFKLKLQFLARVNQAASKVASGESGDTKTDKSETPTSVAAAVPPPSVVSPEDAKEAKDKAKVAGNIQILIREFFKATASFKTVIVPSWNMPVEVVAVAGAKRPSTDAAATGPAKTRPLGPRGATNNRRGGPRRGRR